MTYLPEVALGLSILLNLGLAVYVFFKGTGPTAVEALAEFKAAVMKIKAAKDKSSVDSVAYGTGIAQILEILNPAAPKA